MLKTLRSNPLLEQTLHASRWPSLRITLILLIALLTSTTAGQAWLNDHTPAGARAVLLLLLWLLPLVTMAVAAVSTARRLRDEAFQLAKQSLLTDRQVVWALGLGTLYMLRVVIVLAFGLLPALVDDTPLGGASTALCLIGLHLAASMLGTVLVLRWGRQRLGVVLGVACCALVFVSLPALNTLPSPISTQACQLTTLTPAAFRLEALLSRWKISGPLPMVVAAVLPLMIGWLVSLLPWRGRNNNRSVWLEASALVLAVGLALGLRVMAEPRKHQALAALNQRLSGYGTTCEQLQDLGLQYSNFQGEMPPEIGQLINLTSLDLSNNQLTTLPPGIEKITGLTYLNLSDNKLTHLSPEIGWLTHLEHLDLSHNRLATLTPEIGQLTNLRTLVLTGNQLTELPPEIGQLTNLGRLILSYNQLAELPPEIGQLDNLQGLVGNNNRLATMPPEIGQLAYLGDLSLAYNQFSELPPGIFRLTRLQALDMSGNQLTTLPPEIGQLTGLISLNLSDNQLVMLPPEIGQLFRLMELGLSYNQLTELPPEIGQLALLSGLTLSDNQLTTLPPEIGRLTLLEYLDLSGNRLTALPPEIGKLTYLISLDLSHTGVTERPPEVCQLPNLQLIEPRGLCGQ